MKTHKNTNCIKKKILTAVLFACLVYVYFMIFILSADNAEESSDISIKVMDFFVDIYYKLKGESGENTVIVQNAVPLEKIIRKAAHFTEYMAVGFLSFSIVILWVKRLGIGIGIAFYMIFISKYFININVAIINFIKKIFILTTKPFIFLFKLIKRVFFKPISFICINIKLLSKKIFIILKKTTKITKKTINKEGF